MLANHRREMLERDSPSRLPAIERAGLDTKRLCDWRNSLERYVGGQFVIVRFEVIVPLEVESCRCCELFGTEGTTLAKLLQDGHQAPKGISTIMIMSIISVSSKVTHG